MPTPHPEEFSVIIPALDEEDWIRESLGSARRAFGTDAELVVVDGGSADGTAEIAAAEGARVLHAPRGRGVQLNAGARAAQGRVLVFLHADTLAPAGAAGHVRNALADPRAAGGCFAFGLTPPPGAASRYRLLEGCVNLRTRLLRTATGDQILFARREAFDLAGGYPEIELFEDVALVRALRRVGGFVVLPARARSSRRRWEREGFWRTVGKHLLLRLAYGAGIPPHRLARRYGGPVR